MMPFRRPSLVQTIKSIQRMSTSAPSYKKVLTKDTINPRVVAAEYAVRGELAIKAEELRADLETNPDAPDRLGFSSVIHANIGNPQQLGQKGLTFLRQVCALADYPDLIEHPASAQIFPKDAVARAKTLLQHIGSTGAYTHSKGIPYIRRSVAKYIEGEFSLPVRHRFVLTWWYAARDGYPADPEFIYLTTGASGGVSSIMNLIIANPSVGVLIPIPQYPLYTATLALQDGQACPYYLNEDEGWSTSIDDIRRSLHESRAKGIDVRAIVVINPGNPTGSCLSEEHIKDIIKLAYDESLVILADEVYQSNIFFPEEKGFISFKKALRSLGAPYSDSVELISFHSTSKGQIGECGRRGGYFEHVNLDPEVEAQLYKLVSVLLCGPVSGQIAVDIMVDPPREGEESYETWSKEVTAIHDSLKYRSDTLLAAFRQLEGVECQDAHGAMYLFPTIKLPQKAIEAAKAAGQEPDAFYCMELLKETGICTVPGSGFGQQDGTHHFRTTFLAPQIDQYYEMITTFHKGFMDRYR